MRADLVGVNEKTLTIFGADDKYANEKVYLALNLSLPRRERKKQKELQDMFGCSESTVTRMLRDPRVYTLRDRFILAKLRDSLPAVFNAQVVKAEKGSLGAAQYVWNVAKELKELVEEKDNVGGRSREVAEEELEMHMISIRRKITQRNDTA